MALILSGLIVLLPIGSNGDDPGSANESPLRVTPGAELARWETEVAENPGDANRIVVLAEVLANSGRVTESIPYFERAIELRPDDAQLRVAFGSALQRNGSYYDAELQLLRAVELDPDNISAAYYLAILYEGLPSPRMDEARRWYERTIEIDPDSVIAQQSAQRIEELSAEIATPTTGT
ncbi:MAG TPA: tetratricopeptide repeat protein [Thermomicrobiales bacterium]|nr:tetratricopeptide repeat protein [Thermomicrobiales bacterium]